EAHEIGLVSHRVEQGELDQKLEELVRGLLAKPPEALRQTQQLLRHAAREDILQRMKMESSLFAERLGSAEVKEAISAFFANRASA
ncbi:MAG: enoyl-CoA hydratase/isomerase family protein, partial [Sphingomicrobium sp.]